MSVFLSFRDGVTPNLPSINAMPVDQDFTPQTFTSQYRKEGRDWVVLYNFQAKNTLDIDLVHTFVHAR